MLKTHTNQFFSGSSGEEINIFGTKAPNCRIIDKIRILGKSLFFIWKSAKKQTHEATHQRVSC